MCSVDTLTGEGRDRLPDAAVARCLENLVDSINSSSSNTAKMDAFCRAAPSSAAKKMAAVCLGCEDISDGKLKKEIESASSFLKL